MEKQKYLNGYGEKREVDYRLQENSLFA